MTPKMPRSRYSAVTLTVTFTCLPGVAWADDPPDQGAIRSKSESVITASRQSATVFDTERAASEVSKDELRERPPRTTAAALDEEEGVFLIQPTAASSSPSVRGLTGQQVLLLLDGVRLNSTITPAGPNGLLTLIDPYIVDAIDVVRGPSSALYGNDAVGGVVQVRTRHPVPIADSNIELHAGLRGDYTSYDMGGVGSVSAGGNWGRYSLDSAFSLRHFGDLAGGSAAPYQPMTGYSEGALYLGGGVDLGPGTLVLVYQGFRQQNAVDSALSYPGDLHTIPENSRDLAYLRYSGRFEGKHTLQVQATVSYQRQEEIDDHVQLAQDRIDQLDNYVDILGVTATGDVDLGRGGRVTGGLEGYFDWVTSTAGRTTVDVGPQGTFLPDPGLQPRYPGGSGSQSVGLFLQDEVDVERLLTGGNAAHPGRLKALAAARLGGDFVTVGQDDRLVQLGLGPGRAGFTAANTVYAGSLHLRFEALRGLAATGGVSSGFRAPNLWDYASLGPDAVGYMLPSGNNLSPEVSVSAEGGVRAAFRKLEGGLTYAYTDIERALAATRMGCYVPVMGGCSAYYYVQANQDRAALHAVEATGRLHIGGGLSVFSVLSYATGTLDRAAQPATGTQPAQPAQTEPYSRVPPLNGVAAVQFRRPKSHFTFAEVSMRWAATQTQLSPLDYEDPRICLPTGPSCRGTPGFAVFSIRGAAMLSRNFYVTGAVENLSNTTYRYHGSGVDGPGVGGTLTLDINY